MPIWRALWLICLNELSVELCCAKKVLDITNVMDPNPESYVYWDELANRPVQFWDGNYSDVTTLSCMRSKDLLFDWAKMKKAMATWLKEVRADSRRVMQTYWELIRPVQHSLTNIVAFHNFSTNTDCMIGELAVRIFYLTAQTEQYREHEIIYRNNFVIDWHYVSHKFGWANMARSGWASVYFPSYQILSNTFRDKLPWLSWRDCDALPGGERLPDTFQDILTLVADSERVKALARLVDVVDLSIASVCPVAFSFAAAAVALSATTASEAFHYLDQAQKFIQRYREQKDWTFVNLLNVEWPIWPTLALAFDNAVSWESADVPPTCGVLWCPDGGTPNPTTCACETLFPEDHRNVTVCIFMVDTRRTSSLRNITSVINARFWTLAYGINRLYAESHGYEIEYVQPDNDTHFPERKVGWGKVAVIIEKLRLYGSQRCAYGVSIDTDAYMRTSEPLAAAIHHYELDSSKLILFSQEYHTELRPNNTFINGGFFIVRNSREGVALLQEWYNVPEDYEDMAHLKKQNPQGLNLCWDLKIQPRYAEAVVLAPCHLFTAPQGWFVRHNWFKDLNFEQEMIDVLLQRLFHKYDCIMCNNVYDWDDSLNHDVGPQR